MEKREVLKRIAEKFSDIESIEIKNYVIMCLVAYEAGKAAEKAEKHRKTLV